MTARSMLFFEQLQGGFQPSASSGTCQFIVDGAEDEDFYVGVGSTLSFVRGRHAQPTTTIRMPLDVLDKLVAEGSTFDTRDVDVVSRIDVTGSGNFAELLSRFVKRPAAETLTRFHRAEEKARTAPIARVERVQSPGKETVLEALRAGAPIVAVGSLARWKSLAWDLDEMKRRFGSLRLRPKAGTSGSFETFGEFVDQMQRADDIVYSNGCTLPPAMWRHFEMPFFGAKSFSDPQIWMGSRAVEAPVTPLHRDELTGFLAQVSGRKKLVLYSPDQAELLYPYKAFNTYQPCWAKPWQPDLAAYPLLAKARPIEATLEPSDLLINPAGWFHYVHALDPVVSVSQFLKLELP